MRASALDVKRRGRNDSSLVMAAFLVVTILLLDRFSKILATRIISLHQSVPVIPNLLHFTLVHNRGAGFGILKNQLPFLIGTSIIAIFLVFHNLKKTQGKLYAFSLACILSGALGNLIDRLFFGYVIDFIDFRVWPVFNVADSAITIGAVLLGWSLFAKKEKR